MVYYAFVRYIDIDRNALLFYGQSFMVAEGWCLFGGFCYWAW